MTIAGFMILTMGRCKPGHGVTGLGWITECCSRPAHLAGIPCFSGYHTQHPACRRNTIVAIGSPQPPIPPTDPQIHTHQQGRQGHYSDLLQRKDAIGERWNNHVHHSDSAGDRGYLSLARLSQPGR